MKRITTLMFAAAVAAIAASPVIPANVPKIYVAPSHSERGIAFRLARSERNARILAQMWRRKASGALRTLREQIVARRYKQALNVFPVEGANRKGGWTRGGKIALARNPTRSFPMLRTARSSTLLISERFDLEQEVTPRELYRILAQSAGGATPWLETMVPKAT